MPDNADMAGEDTDESQTPSEEVQGSLPSELQQEAAKESKDSSAMPPPPVPVKKASSPTAPSLPGGMSRTEVMARADALR